VDSSTLTQKQIDALTEAIGDRLLFLGNLQRRMERLRFSPQDRLYVATMKAYNAMHELRVVSLYLRPGGWAG
jgi:hypothetical protein